MIELYSADTTIDIFEIWLLNPGVSLLQLVPHWLKRVVHRHCSSIVLLQLTIFAQMFGIVWVSRVMVFSAKLVLIWTLTVVISFVVASTSFSSPEFSSNAGRTRCLSWSCCSFFTRTTRGNIDTRLPTNSIFTSTFYSIEIQLYLPLKFHPFNRSVDTNHDEQRRIPWRERVPIKLNHFVVIILPKQSCPIAIVLVKRKSSLARRGTLALFRSRKSSLLHQSGSYGFVLPDYGNQRSLWSSYGLSWWFYSIGASRKKRYPSDGDIHLVRTIFFSC